jgi:hypothetical protein
MKIFALAVVLVFLGNVASADNMTKEEIISTLNKSNLSSLVDLYSKGALVLDAAGTTVNKMQLKRNGASYYNSVASQARFWYRGMGITETNQLIKDGYTSVNWNVPSFVGIAPEFSYAKSYLTIENPGAVVEFGTDNAGWLSNQWTTGHGCQVKSEGGGTYGLGTKGTISSCNKPAFMPAVAGLGKIFSDWMRNTTITTRIVWVLVPRK